MSRPRPEKIIRETRGSRHRVTAFCVVLVTAMVLLARPQVARALTCNWQAGSNSTWSAGGTGNWSCGRIPTTADTVNFASANSNFNCSIDVNTTVVDFTIASTYTGTISPSTSPRKVIVTGNFSQAGASSTFTAPSTLIVKGTFSHSAGTFTPGTGLVVLGSTGSPSHTFTSMSFNNLTFNDALIAYWKLDESADGSAGGAVDSSGWGHHMTYQGTPTHTSTTASTPYRNPYAVVLTKGAGAAYGNYAELTSYPTTLQPTTWTIAAWVKAGASTDGSGSEIINLGDDYGLRVLTTGNVRVHHLEGGSHVSCDSTGVDIRGGWHHVVGAYSGSAFTLYVDNVVPSNGGGCTGNAAQTFAGTNAYIGRHPGNGNYDFDGTVDDVRVYNRVLSAQEVEALYVTGQGALSGGSHTAGTSLDVNGDLVIGTGSLTSSNSISVAGSWLNHGGLYTGTGTVTFDGTGSGLLLRTNGQRFNALTVNAAGSWTMDDRLYVDGVLSQSAGTVATSSYVIHAGTLSKTGGTLTVGTGTIVVDSRSAQTLRSDTALNHLRVESSSETGLVGYWKFDAAAGTTVRDWSGTGNNGTLNGSWDFSPGLPTTNFDNAHALILDGSSAYMSLGTTSIPATNASQTIALWIYYTALPGAAKTFVETIDTAGSSYGNRLGISSANAIQLWKAAAASTQVLAVSVSNTTTYPLSTWRHVAYTYDASASPAIHKIFIDGVEKVSSTTAAGSVTPNSVRVGARQTGAEYFDGRIDDLRVYNVALTTAQIASLAAGRYAGTGAGATFTLGADATVNGTLAVDNGTLATSSYTLGAAASDATKVATVHNGGLNVGSTSATFGGGLTVKADATLAINTTGGSVKIANGKTLTIDGTLDASTAGATPTIQCSATSSCNYTFTVGSTATATPALNIDGLAVKQTDTNGMYINTVSGSTTTFTSFNNIAFSGGTGNYLLQIAAGTLTLYANGLSFDTTGNTYNAKLTDRDGAGNDVRLYVGGTCTPTTDCESIDVDDDTKLIDGTTNGSDGIPDDAGNDGSVIQWLYRSHTDTGGTAVGFPTSAFDWNTYAYRKTYVTYNNVASSTGRLYARDTDGYASSGTYYWSPAAGLNFVGTPRFSQETSGMTTNYYVWVLTTNGSVYKIQDTGSALTTVASYPFRDGASATATSPLMIDSSNVYWAGNNGSGSRKMFSLPQTSTTLNGSGSLTADVTVFPTLATISGTTFIFAAISGTVYKMPSNFGANTTSTQPTTAASGRMSQHNNLLYFIENQGKVWALNTSDLSTSWSYQDTNVGRHPGGCTSSNQCSSQNIFLQALTGRITYGDKDGHVYVVASGSLLSGYPFRPGTSSDIIITAPLVSNGIIAVGTSGGKVFLIDQQNASSAPALLRTYNFGSAISSISYDHDNASSGQYMISTADGRLFYVSRITDPTPAND